MRATLIALQIAASLSLVAGSTLMVRTVMAMLNADLGIDASSVLMSSMTLRHSKYPDAASRLALFERTLSRLAETAGMQSAALCSSWPLQQPRLRAIEIEGPAGRTSGRAAVHVVSEAYFSTFSIPVRSGRVFTAADRLGGEAVAIVSETLARRTWPGGQSPVGQRLILPPAESPDQAMPQPKVVVGVVADVRQDPADTDAADVYLPFRQAPDRFTHVLVKTNVAPDAWLPQLRPAFRDIDPEISVARAQPVQDLVDESRARPRFLASLLAAFALLAGFVAVVGAYGMTAYAVRQREREIAVRIAIGANPRSVMGLFLRQGGVMIGAGLALGLIGAVGAGRLLESQLFGVQASDPGAIGTAVLALAGSALLAVWWPSRRATQIDPVAALRAD
jgi:predicted permease